MKKFVISAICASGVVLLASNHGATASSINRHSVSISKQSLLVILAGFGCNLVNGQLVCGQSGKNKNSDNENDDEADEHENSKKHKKHQDADTDGDDGLTQCSIQESSGGGGCVVGFKHVCEKLKNGKKCCGCVPDKNAQAAQPRQFCCTAMSGTQVGPQFCEPTRAEAEREASFTRLNGQPPSSIPCIVECLVNGSFSHQPGACK